VMSAWEETLGVGRKVPGLGFVDVLEK